MIHSDFNSKIGSKKENYHITDIVENFGIRECNEEVINFLQFAVGNDMMIGYSRMRTLCQVQNVDQTIDYSCWSSSFDCKCPQRKNFFKK